MSADLLDTLLTHEVAAVMRITPKALLNALSAGAFLPLPIAERPYRWNRDDIEAWKRGEYKAALARLREQVRKRRARRAA